MKTTTPPDWFSTSIRQGLAQTYANCLPGSPAAELVGATTASWIDDLWHDERYAWQNPDTDAARIGHAFRMIRRTADRWPTLTDFSRHLPAPPEAPALKHQPCSPEQAAANVARLQAMVEEMFGVKS